jgi:hypothetical protein
MQTLTLLIFQLSDAIIAVVKSLKESFVNDALDWVNVFRIVAATGAIIFITRKYFADQSAGKPLDINSYMRPFIIMIMLMLYVPIIRIIDGFFDSLDNKSNKMWVSVVQDALANKAVIGAAGQITQTLASSLLGGTNGSPGTDVAGTPEQIQMMNHVLTVSTLAQNPFNNKIMEGSNSDETRNAQSKVGAIDFIKLMANSSGPLIKLLGRITLIILFILGPLALALSLFPTFDKSLNTWLATYVKMSLWATISNLVSYVLMVITFDPRIIGALFFNSLLGGYGDGTGTAVFYGAMLVTQASVPSIAGAIVSAAGFDSLSFSLQNQGLSKVMNSLK